MVKCRVLSCGMLLGFTLSINSRADCQAGLAAVSSKDYLTALKEFTASASQSDACSQANLGVAYENGRGVTQGYQEALKWYRRSAEQGHAWAQNNLGVMYEMGQGIPQDVVLAHMWYSIGAKASSGDERKTSLENRNHVAAQMTVSQIGKAHEMARRCQDTKFKDCE